jgi:hypothetical protein
LEEDKRILLVLFMILSAQYRSLAQFCIVMEGITVKKVMEMFREEVRYQEDKNMARNVSFIEKGEEFWHRYKKGHNKEDCWFLYS